MADDTLTFAMGGRVEIGQFQEGITRFQRLVAALTPRAGVKWIVDDLQAGSAVITLRAETEAPEKAAEIVEAYGSIGKALERSEPLRCNKRARKAVEAIKDLAGTVEYVRLETPSVEYTVSRNGQVVSGRAPLVSIGAVTGQIQTLSNRGGLKFNLYDSVHDKAVSCYLQSGQEELMRKVWGRQARVSGKVSRDANLGIPMAIRQILNIEILEEPSPGAYQRAKGAVSWQPGYEEPEAVIRRLRDG